MYQTGLEAGTSAAGLTGSGCGFRRSWGSGERARGRAGAGGGRGARLTGHGLPWREIGRAHV